MHVVMINKIQPFDIPRKKKKIIFSLWAKEIFNYKGEKKVFEKYSELLKSEVT